MKGIIIKLEHVQLVSQKLTWNEFLELITNKLSELKLTTPKFSLEVTKIIEKYGFYFVLSDEIALVHTAIGDHILQTSLSLFLAQEGLKMGDKNPHLIFVLLTQNAQDHMQLIAQFAQTFRDQDFVEKLIKAEDETTLKKLLKSKSF